ncbi:MAG: hypothetical protein GY859_00375 [Desulfobacterales bacterium]|nr:hypothetical protein [Desulfobacterales bacterium]
MEQRKYTRLTLKFESEAVIKWNDVTIVGKIADLSVRDLFLESDEIIPLDERVECTIRFPGISSTTNVNDGVVTRHAENGFAVQFESMDRERFLRMMNFIVECIGL